MCPSPLQLAHKLTRWLPSPSAQQVSPAVGERPDGGVHGGAILQAEVQPPAEVPTPAMPAGWPGAEAHVPAPGGEDLLGGGGCFKAADCLVGLHACIVLFRLVSPDLPWPCPWLTSLAWLKANFCLFLLFPLSQNGLYCLLAQGRPKTRCWGQCAFKAAVLVTQHIVTPNTVLFTWWYPGPCPFPSSSTSCTSNSKRTKRKGGGERSPPLLHTSSFVLLCFVDPGNRKRRNGRHDTGSRLSLLTSLALVDGLASARKQVSQIHCWSIILLLPVFPIKRHLSKGRTWQAGLPILPGTTVVAMSVSATERGMGGSSLAGTPASSSSSLRGLCFMALWQVSPWLWSGSCCVHQILNFISCSVPCHPPERPGFLFLCHWKQHRAFSGGTNVEELPVKGGAIFQEGQ